MRAAGGIWFLSVFRFINVDCVIAAKIANMKENNAELFFRCTCFAVIGWDQGILFREKIEYVVTQTMQMFVQRVIRGFLERRPTHIDFVFKLEGSLVLFC